MTRKIQHTANPDHTAYVCDTEYQNDQLGNVRIVSSCERLPENYHSYDNGGEYHIIAYLDDTITVNRKDYTHVHIRARAQGEGPEDWKQYRSFFAESYRTPLTPAAADTISDAVRPIIEQYIADHGGVDAVKKHARNEARRRKAGYERSQAEMHTKAANDIEFHIEP